MKSDIEIKDDLYTLLKNSELASVVTGKVCKVGERPKGSTKEDIVIAVIGNLNGQIQEASVAVNIYVQDDLKADGQNLEATRRLRQLCSLSSQLLEVGYGDDYRFTLESQRVLPVKDTKEHVISNRLNYKQVNE